MDAHARLRLIPLSVILALLVSASLAVPAFADDGAPPADPAAPAEDGGAAADPGGDVRLEARPDPEEQERRDEEADGVEGVDGP